MNLSGRVEKLESATGLASDGQGRVEWYIVMSVSNPLTDSEVEAAKAEYIARHGDTEGVKSLDLTQWRPTGGM